MGWSKKGCHGGKSEVDQRVTEGKSEDLGGKPVLYYFHSKHLLLYLLNELHSNTYTILVHEICFIAKSLVSLVEAKKIRDHIVCVSMPCST